MTISEVALYHYRLPLAEPLPVGERRLTERRGLLLRVTDEDGAEGWGEAAPLPGFSPESLDEATDGAQRLRARLTGLHVPAAEIDAVLRAVPTSDVPPSVRFAAEGAVVELMAARRGGSVTRVLGGTTDTVALNALITTDADLEVAAEQVRRAGYRAVKLKVGRAAVEADVQRVRRLHAALGDTAVLRLDANRKWECGEAVSFAEAVDDIPLAYVEEPLQDPTNLVSLVEATGLPVALDETTREWTPEEVPAALPVRAVVLKPTLLGGITETRRWAAWARRRAAAPVISASYESGIGLRMLVALAGALSNGPVGLSTYPRLAADVLRPRLPLSGAAIDVEQVYASDVDRTAVRLLASRN